MKNICLIFFLIISNIALISAVDMLSIESWNGFGIREGEAGNGYSRFLIPDYEAYWGDNEVPGTGKTAEEIAEMYKPYYSLGKKWDGFTEGEKPDTTYYRIIKGKDPYANNHSTYLVIYFNYYEVQCWIEDHIYDAEPVFIWFEDINDIPYRIAYDSIGTIFTEGDHYNSVISTYAWKEGHFNYDDIEDVYTQGASYFPQGIQNFSSYRRGFFEDAFAEIKVSRMSSGILNFEKNHVKLGIPYSCNTLLSDYDGGIEFPNGSYNLAPLNDEKLIEWYNELPGNASACGNNNVKKCIFSYDISDPFHGLFWEAYNVCEPKFVKPIISVNSLEITNTKNLLYLNELQVNDDTGGNMDGLWKDRFRITINNFLHFCNLVDNFNYSKYNLMFNIDSNLKLEGDYEINIKVKDNLDKSDTKIVIANIDNTPPNISLINKLNRWIENNFLNLTFKTHENADCNYEFILNSPNNLNWTSELEFESNNLEHYANLSNLIDTLENENYQFKLICKDGHDNEGIDIIEFEVDACKPNWVEYNSCLDNKSVLYYSEDSNFCKIQSHRNESIPENFTKFCGGNSCGEYGDNYCNEGDVYHMRNCNNNGCVFGGCFNERYEEDELVDNCNNNEICEKGVCKEKIPFRFLVSSPNKNTYNERKILLDLNSTKTCENILYIDYVSSRPKWNLLCKNCNEYSKTKNLGEGEHNLSFRCINDGDLLEKEVDFFIDSKAPRISKTEPKRNKVTNGKGFYIKFKEDNLKNITLTFNPIFSLDLDTCTESRGYYECYTDLNLTNYNNQYINYYFSVEDIAGNKDESKPITIQVDTTLPVLNNPESFWEQGTGRYNRYIYFDFDITEKNFEEVTYTYIDNRGKEKEKRLCSRLKNGICETKKSFSRGQNNITIHIKDEAGNSIQKEINFIVN